MGLLIYHAEKPDDVSSYRLIYANREASRCTGTDLGHVVGMDVMDRFQSHVWNHQLLAESSC